MPSSNSPQDRPDRRPDRPRRPAGKSGGSSASGKSGGSSASGKNRAAPRKSPGRSPGPRPKRPAARGLLRLRRLDANRFALQVPVCALERAEDLEEVHEMIAQDELDIARDELLYLVADCRAFLSAHNLLGELALRDEDIPLARGHYGFAYEVGLDSLPPGFRGTLPTQRDYNGEFFLAGRGLARCLIARGQRAEGRAVLQNLQKLDPRNTDVRDLLAELDEQERLGLASPALPILDDPAADEDEDDDD